MYFKNENALKKLILAQGGTAVGTGLNTRKILIKNYWEISKITKIPFKPSLNKFAALAA